MASTRNVKSPGVLASAATVGVPATPIAGAAYRDPAALAVMLASGWKYGTPVNSAGENQYNFQASTLLDLLDKHGVLGWCDLVDYETPALVFGSDGVLYRALANSGPAGAGAQDPTSSTGYWVSLFSDSRVGETVLVQGTGTVPGGVKMNGGLVSRTGIYADLWAWANAAGLVISDAAWTGDALNCGYYSSGDGATTFRLPNARGLFPRFYHDGDTTDPDFATRGVGRVQGFALQTHYHTYYASETSSNSSAPDVERVTGFRGFGYDTSGVVGAVTASETRPANIPFMAWVKYR